MPLSPQSFQKLVLTWYDQHGRKNFPWQQNKTPYSVWVSEIMLQQTQVSTVIPYFERFMKSFPTLKALAKASDDEVLHHWSGLGYYSRARNLHKSAKLIQSEFKGKFPDNLEDLQKLPGVGRSTAGAILSCGFNEKAAILDGNVKRLLNRFHAVNKPIDDLKTLNELWELSEAYTPSKRNSDYTQVVMDLGATICIRKKPLCSSCPLSKNCKALKEGLVDQLPFKGKRRTVPTRALNFLILQHQDKVLLIKRPATGIWGSLWSLPELPSESSKETIKDYCSEHFDLKPSSIKALAAFRHTFSHYHLEIQPLLLKLKTLSPKSLASKSRIWYSLLQPEALGLPAPIQSLLESISR